MPGGPSFGDNPVTTGFGAIYKLNFNQFNKKFLLISTENTEFDSTKHKSFTKIKWVAMVCQNTLIGITIIKLSNLYTVIYGMHIDSVPKRDVNFYILK